MDPNWKGDFNVYVRADKDPGWDKGRETAARLKLDVHSLWADENSPGLKNLDEHDVGLKPDSPARARGTDLSQFFEKALPGCEPGYFSGKAPDVGAVPFGSPMPRLPRKPEEVKVPAAGTWPGPAGHG